MRYNNKIASKHHSSLGPVRWILILLSHVFIFLLTDCKSDKKEIRGKPITIKPQVALNWIGHWRNEGMKGDLVRQRARQFEFENQDIKVNLKFPEDIYYFAAEGIYEERFLAQQFSLPETEWDIVRVNRANYSGTILKGNDWVKEELVDLYQYKEIIDQHYPAIFDERFKEQWQGIFPGPALDGFNLILWCNLDVAKKVGITVKQFNVTYDEFLGYIKAVTDYNKVNNTEIIGLFDLGDWSWIDPLPVQLFCSELGDYDLIKTGADSELRWAAFEKTVNAMEQLGKYKAFPKDRSKFTWLKSKSDPYLKDICLFYIQATWMYNIWLAEDSLHMKKMLPVQLPEFKPSKTYLGEYWIPWAILKKSPHVEQAVRFMKFMSSPDVADRWIRSTKSPIGIKNKFVSTTFGFDPFESFDYEIAQKFSNTKIVYTENSSFFLGKRNRDIPFSMREVMYGNITAHEYLKTIQPKLKK